MCIRDRSMRSSSHFCLVSIIIIIISRAPTLLFVQPPDQKLNILLEWPNKCFCPTLHVPPNLALYAYIIMVVINNQAYGEYLFVDDHGYSNKLLFPSKRKEVVGYGLKHIHLCPLDNFTVYQSSLILYHSWGSWRQGNFEND